ncbi:CotH protein [Anaerohalosphaera lusitana]|uniref:CotH protein n=1 Tax=Anaerohalosphaera lusitana TaxID=1936003 RepID=A0A1U9NPH2_9BACT|nr:lamin tail domain-containing protein [Anaerohalosphaera lusitana]AQT69809.1 CotH protein [Anaerohalosphaera lusitana]
MKSRSNLYFVAKAWCLVTAVLLLGGFAHSCFITGDLDGDCRVGIGDLALMASQWLNPTSCENETGLTLHWKLDESIGSNAADSSSSGYQGAVNGASWNPHGGRLAGALEFDGVDDFVQTDPTEFMGLTGTVPRTCTAWIKTSRAGGGIMAWGSSVDTALWLVWIDETGVLRVDVGGGHVVGTTVLTDDLWHHVTVVSDGSTTDDISLYVDGKLEPVRDVLSQSVNTWAVTAMKIGKYYSTEKLFEGLIDDVRIYNRVLSMQEVWNLAATATIDINCADLNLDETVDLQDLVYMSQGWGEESPPILINEFLADNESKSPLENGELLDGNGESSDWIELHNNSEITLDISGWYLTDDAGLKTKWQFPASTVIQPGEYLIVFASGKTQPENPGNYPYVDPAGFLHTNFKLSKDGEYLGLIDNDGVTPVHEYNHFDMGKGERGYPAQEADISYGYYYGEVRYFSAPTPGADNAKNTFEAFVEKPEVNIKGGCYMSPVSVSMTCDTPSAIIRYTTDGTLPTLTNGWDYTAPITVNQTTTVLARAFKPGFQPSKTRIDTYIFVDPAVSPSNTNLPIVVVDTLGVSIPSDRVNKPYIDCRTVIIDVDEATGRAEITGPEDFEGWAMIRRRGESTYNSGHYAIEIQDEYREDKKVSLLGMPDESDWILSWDVIDYTMMKNEMAFKWFRDMGHYAPRQRYVELYLNTDGGAVSSADYQGLFILREKIKRDQNRVDIARLDASHNLEPKVSGGYIVKSDKYDDGSVLLADGPDGLVDPDYLEASPYGIQVTGAGKPIVDEPEFPEITQPQINWIAGFLNETSSVLWQNTSSTFYPGPHAVYADYIDVVSWIDHGLLEQICSDSDAFWGSYYTHKDRTGKIHSGPPWDYDRGFHNNSGTYDQPTYVWKTNGSIFGKWHQKMQEDPEYRLMVADRWFEHREKVLSTDETMAYIDQTAAMISEARSRPRKYYPNSFDTEIALFKDWITSRFDWLDGYIASQFGAVPPILSPSGGYLSPGGSIYPRTPAGASGNIYYTLNGEDPRLKGGAVNPDAQLYIEPDDSTVETLVSEDAPKAVLVPGNDIGMNWTGGAEPYDDSAWTHGTPTTGVTVGGVGYDERTTYKDYITYDVETLMSDVRQTCYIRIPFTAVADQVANALSMTLRMRYDDGFRAYLNGAEIASANAPISPSWDDGATGLHGDSSAVTQIDFDCSEHLSHLQAGDNILAIRGFNRGLGSSDFLISAQLVLEVAATGSPVTLEKSTCVKARVRTDGEWSALNRETYAVGPVLESLRISEIMYHPSDTNTEFIELQNVGDDAINLNLVHFTDGVDFVFGDYTLAAGEYVLIVENRADFEARYGSDLPVAGQYVGALDNAGEEIVLRDAIGAEIHDFDYNDSWYELTDGIGYSLTMVDPAATDPNLWDTKAGWRSSLYTGGSPGTAPHAVIAADSIIFNELLAHSHGADADWIELYNTTEQEINIGGWFLTDDDSDPNTIRKYQIPDNTVIASGDYMVFEEHSSFGDPTGTGSNLPFGLSEGGETVYLYSGQGGEVTGLYQTQQTFDASETGVTFGRYQKAELSGGYDFVRQSSLTPGAANDGPLIPEVVITEIYYKPPSGADYEFVELYNRSGSAVTLETEAKTETSPGVFFTEDIPWRLEGTGYEFPAGVTIPPYSYIIVARNPANYSSALCPVYGPYDGKLDNGGEEIEIQIPGDQEYGKARYWMPIEKIDYDDAPPWPTSADGGGHSLHRQNFDTYGRDHSNWEAASPSPGY